MKNIFFDHNSTTDILPEVKEVMLESMNHPYNASSTHQLGRKAKQLVNQAKQKILTSINANSTEYEVIFTGSGTEANNLVMQGELASNIIISDIEHSSILTFADKVHRLNKLRVNTLGQIDPVALKKVLSVAPNKCLLSVIYANNETGVIQNFDKLFSLIGDKVITHSDVTQAYGKIPLNLQKTPFDLVTISGHKCGGPQGIGALIKKKNIKLHPLMHGGSQELGYRPGTENIAAICGFAKIAENITQINDDYSKLAEIRDYIESELTNYSNNFEVICQNSHRLPNTSSLHFKDINNDLLLIKLDLQNIYVSAGSACSSGKIEPSHVIKAITDSDDIANSTIRVSLGLTNSIAQAKEFVMVCKKIIDEQHSIEQKRA